jgi:IclR family pca regulon transcriptional regulator
MRELAPRIHESTSLAVLSPTGEEIHYTARVATSGVMSVDFTVGTRLPAHATSMGRVLLADQPESQLRFRDLRPLTARTITDPATLSRVLADARAQGYAVVDGELEEGLRSIAVPVRDRSGRVVAALNAATHAVRRTVEECVHDLLPELTRAAGRIETDLHMAGRFTYVPLT